MIHLYLRSNMSFRSSYILGNICWFIISRFNAKQKKLVCKDVDVISYNYLQLAFHINQTHALLHQMHENQCNGHNNVFLTSRNLRIWTIFVCHLRTHQYHEDHILYYKNVNENKNKKHEKHLEEVLLLTRVVI